MDTYIWYEVPKDLHQKVQNINSVKLENVMIVMKIFEHTIFFLNWYVKYIFKNTVQ